MTFGRRVLGDDTYAAQVSRKADRKKKGRGLGKRVTGDIKPLDVDLEETETEETSGEPENTEDLDTDGLDGDGTEGEGEDGEDGEGGDQTPPAPTLSISELGKALKENESEEFFDKAFAAEMDRPEGAPRKGALKLLLDAEKRRETPRAPIVKELNDALKEA